MVAVVLAVFFVKRLPSNTEMLPSNLFEMINCKRRRLLSHMMVWSEGKPTFFTGINNEYRDMFLCDMYTEVYGNIDVDGPDPYILHALAYLLSLSFSVEHVECLLKILLACQFPGNWFRSMFVFAGRMKAGKSKLCEILCKTVAKSNTIAEIKKKQSNAPELSSLADSFIVKHDEIGKFATSLKEIISESEICYREHHKNTTQSFYNMAEIMIMCNEIPTISDGALVDRIIPIIVSTAFANVTPRLLRNFNWLKLDDIKTMFGEDEDAASTFAHILNTEPRLENARDQLTLIADESCSQMMASVFYYFNRRDSLSILYKTQDHIITLGLEYITFAYSWIKYFQTINQPVDLTMPPKMAKEKRAWQESMDPYYMWKRQHKIRVDPAAANVSIHTSLIEASLEMFGATVSHPNH